MCFWSWLDGKLQAPELAPGADGHLGPTEVQKLFAGGTVSFAGRVDYAFHPDGTFEWDEGRERGTGTYSIGRDGTLHYRFGKARLFRRGGVLLVTGTESWVKDLPVGN